MERERVTVQQAAARLGITESAVRKRVSKGDLRSEKVLEGNRERLYVFLDPDAAPFPEPFQEKYMRSLEDRVKTLEDEVMRQQAIILSMSQSLRALTGAPEAPQGVEEAQKEAETSQPSTGGAKRATTRTPATSAPTSRLGMSAWALAVSAIATPLTWVFRVLNGGVSVYLLVLLFLFPLLPGLWAGSTKRPSLPWFSSPHRWLRHGGRSVLETAVFAAGMPSGVGLAAANLPVTLDPQVAVSPGDLAFPALLVFATASLAFMSGAFLGNALRRVGFLGTPKELPQGDEEGDGEEEVWSAKKEARWGLAGTLIAAVISAVASVVAATLS